MNRKIQYVSLFILLTTASIIQLHAGAFRPISVLKSGGIPRNSAVENNQSTVSRNSGKFNKIDGQQTLAPELTTAQLYKNLSTQPQEHQLVEVSLLEPINSGTASPTHQKPTTYSGKAYEIAQNAYHASKPFADKAGLIISNAASNASGRLSSTAHYVGGKLSSAASYTKNNVIDFSKSFSKKNKNNEAGMELSSPTSQSDAMRAWLETATGATKSSRDANIDVSSIPIFEAPLTTSQPSFEALQTTSQPLDHITQFRQMRTLAKQNKNQATTTQTKNTPTNAQTIREARLTADGFVGSDGKLIDVHVEKYTPPVSPTMAKKMYNAMPNVSGKVNSSASYVGKKLSNTANYVGKKLTPSSAKNNTSMSQYDAPVTPVSNRFQAPSAQNNVSTPNFAQRQAITIRNALTPQGKNNTTSKTNTAQANTGNFNGTRSGLTQQHEYNVSNRLTEYDFMSESF